MLVSSFVLTVFEHGSCGVVSCYPCSRIVALFSNTVCIISRHSIFGHSILHAVILQKTIVIIVTSIIDSRLVLLVLLFYHC